MERICCIGGAAGASILAVASVDDLMIWAWLLIAAELAVWMLLREEVQKQIKSVPVLCESAPVTPRDTRRLLALPVAGAFIETRS